MKDETENRPKLVLVASEGKENREGLGKRTGRNPETGLTAKQQRFAELLAEGHSSADAYRGSYDASNMKAATVHNEASKLFNNPAIAERVQAIIAEKKQKNSMFTDRQREKYSDRVWRNLWAMIDAPDTPPAVKANLLSLGAKAAGMLTEQVKIENVSSDSQSIEKELIERLQRLKSA
jgi:hypothetical protein